MILRLKFSHSYWYKVDGSMWGLIVVRLPKFQDHIYLTGRLARSRRSTVG